MLELGNHVVISHRRRGPAAHWLMRFALALILCIPAAALAQSLNLLRAYQQFEEAKAANDLPAALTSGQRALQLTEATPDGDPRQLLDMLRSLAEVSARAGRDQDATQLYQRALALQEAALGTDGPDLVPLLTALADLAIKDRMYQDAAALLQRMLGIERAAYGEQHPNVLATADKLRAVYRTSNDTEALSRLDAQLNQAELARRSFRIPAEGPSKDGRYRQNDQGFATVRVFYGTNRAPTGLLKPAEYYGRERGDLQYGSLEVTIPSVHKEAELETQSRWSIDTFIVGPAALRSRYVLLDKVTPLPRDSFVSALREQIKQSPSKDVFIFVHGFNTTFEDAARRTAQLAYDLDFDGTPIMYAWPSQGSTTAYTVDEASVAISGRKMAQFLEDVVAQSGAERIHLIAHSMGNRALIEAMQTYLAKRAPAQRTHIFGQVVFTAPDVDRDYFVDAVAALSGAAERTTLYASDKDLALKTSQALHGAPRAGTAGAYIITLAGLDTIDMSAVAADMLGHTYFADNAGAIYDLFRLLWRGDPPPRRCGMSDSKNLHTNLSVWLFNVDVCKGDDLLEAGVLLKRFGDRARARVLANMSGLTDPSQKQEWSRILTRLNGLLLADDQTTGAALK